MRFSAAYAADEEVCRDFVPRHANSTEDRRAAVAQAKLRPISDAVKASLLVQNKNPDDAQAKNLERLSDAVMVVTGQQLGLFGGPLYTVYKACSAVVVARELEAQTATPVVPVFWLQSEDHDFDEVATTWVPRAVKPPLSLSVKSRLDSRVSMFHRRFGDDVETALSALGDEIGNFDFAEVTLAQLKRHYRSGASWSEALAGWIAEVFANTGLLVFDPRSPDVAVCSQAVHQRAFSAAASISQGLRQRCEALRASDFDTQVHIRPGSPLFFFHPEGPSGPRYRLDPRGDEYDLVGFDSVLTKAELETKLSEAPRCFSTSALLRPVLQDSLLPTAAYVGGPGEIDYFAQIQPVYEAFDLPMPLLVPRNRFCQIDDRSAGCLDDFGLQLDDLNNALDDLLKTAGGTERRAADDLRTEMTNTLRRAFDKLAPTWQGLAGLDQARDKTMGSMMRSFDKMLDKYTKAGLHEDKERLAHVEQLQWALTPRAGPQERTYGLPYYAARYGSAQFIKRLLEASTAFDGSLQEMRW